MVSQIKSLVVVRRFAAHGRAIILLACVHLLRSLCVSCRGSPGDHSFFLTLYNVIRVAGRISLMKIFVVALLFVALASSAIADKVEKVEKQQWFSLLSFRLHVFPVVWETSSSPLL